MSIDQAMANLRQAKLKEVKKPKKKPMPPKKISGFRIKKSPKKGVVIVAKKELVDIKESPVRDAMKHFAASDFGIKLATASNKLGLVEFWTSNSTSKALTPAIASKITKTASDYLIDRYKIDPFRLIQSEKKRRMAEMYGSGTKGFASSGYVGYVNSSSNKYSTS